MSGAVVDAGFERQLFELQSIDFVLVELTLYLDTHPDDTDALAQFQQFHQRKRALMRALETAYGPLQQYGNSGVGKSWKWNDAPWPWQI